MKYAPVLVISICVLYVPGPGVWLLAGENRELVEWKLLRAVGNYRDCVLYSCSPYYPGPGLGNFAIHSIQKCVLWLNV